MLCLLYIGEYIGCFDFKNIPYNIKICRKLGNTKCVFMFHYLLQYLAIYLLYRMPAIGIIYDILVMHSMI